jgi:hypothetical protein
MTKVQNYKAEVVFALKGEQIILPLEVPIGSRIEDVINKSGIKDRYPSEPLNSCAVGVWGKVRERNTVIEDGDRIELYRLLHSDPKDRRRSLALLGKSMSQKRVLIDLD